MAIRSLRYGPIAPLFDLSFTEFLTLKIAKVLYLLSMIGLGLLALFLILGGFQRSFMTGLGALLLGGLLFMLALTVIRVWLEATVVFFRIADHAAEISEHIADVALNTRDLPRDAHPAEHGA